MADVTMLGITKPGAELLLIDDDQSLTNALQVYLQRAGYQVVIANSSAEGLELVAQREPDLVLLDVLMPKMDGWEICRRIRVDSTVPIVILSAKDQEADRVRGLKLGADDYVCKPFSLKELEARVDAILRRVRACEEERHANATYINGDLVIDITRWGVWRNGDRIDLTATESRVLFLLAEYAGETLSHAQLLEGGWGPEYVENTGYTKLFIWRLRQKLEPNPSDPRYILTDRGVGYRLAASH